MKPESVTNTVANVDRTYTLDALGNWGSSATGAGTGTATAPTPTSTSRTNNSQNELTAIGGSGQTFDNNGNMTSAPATYDAWNRMITFGGGYATYSYLPGADRATESSCGSNVVDSYYSTDMQDLEDDTSCCGVATPQSQYVWGLDYVNQMVERDDSSTSGSLGISGSGLGVRIYPQQDANFNVKTLTSNTGSVLEHIDYDSYGNAKLLTSAYGTSGTAFGSDSYKWVYGFQGGRFDPLTGLYHFGARDYSPVLGRWMEQDGGYWDGSNLYQAFDGDPASLLDPTGSAPATQPSTGPSTAPVATGPVASTEYTHISEPATPLLAEFSRAQTIGFTYIGGFDIKVTALCLSDGKNYQVKSATAVMSVVSDLATSREVKDLYSIINPTHNNPADIQADMTKAANTERGWQQDYEQAWDADAKAEIAKMLAIPPGTPDVVRAKAATIEAEMIDIIARKDKDMHEADAQKFADQHLRIPRTKSVREYKADFQPITDFSVSFYANPATMPSTAPASRPS